VTATLTPEQERALRERVAGNYDDGQSHQDRRVLLAALDAERERSGDIQSGWARATIACAKAEVERDAARARGDTFAIDYARLEAKYVDETEALRARVAELEAENGRLRAALGPPAVRLVQSCQDCSGGFCKRCRDDIQAAIQAALEGK
jgi:hypothetical protein